MAHIVADDQTCGAPGRTILSNVFILRDLVVICKQKNIPVAVVSIDQMKAFEQASKAGIFAQRARVDQAVGLYYRKENLTF